jgi:hypothetical protein
MLPHHRALGICPEYQAVVAAGYNEEALLQQVLEACKDDEDARFEVYNDAIALTGMVAQHMVSLPPPPPLPPHTRQVADYEGQEVPPPPGVSRRQRHHDRTATYFLYGPRRKRTRTNRLHRRDAPARGRCPNTADWLALDMKQVKQCV